MREADEEASSSSEDNDKDASLASAAGVDAALEAALSRVPEPSCRSNAQKQFAPAMSLRLGPRGEGPQWMREYHARRSGSCRSCKEKFLTI